METRQHKRISLAQNFLRSPKLVRRLVAMSTIGPSTVYEIGPGNGIITAELARVATRVIAIEKDPELVRHLRERFRLLDNVEIVEKDVLAYWFGTSEHKVFANLPFNRTPQGLRKILHARSKLIEAQDAVSYRDFVRFGFGRWKPSLKLAFKNVFTYKQWKRLARDLEFPLNATPTELSLEQWLGLYHGFRYYLRAPRSSSP